jgi:hypothetical protein
LTIIFIDLEKEPSNFKMQPSNTLVICGLDRADFSAGITDQLRDFIDNEINVLEWATLRSFGRIIAVFGSIDECRVAKSMVPKFNNTLKAYYTKETALQDTELRLQLPDKGKLWLISPPPSPPVGWASRIESEPNKEMYFDTTQLKEALEKAHALREQYDQTPDQTVVIQSISQDGGFTGKLVRRCTLKESSPNPALTVDTDLRETVSEPSSRAETPSIVLEWDDDDGYFPAVDNSTRFVRTEMPPIA